MRKNRSAAVAAAFFLLLTGAGIAAAPSAHAGSPGGTHASDRNSDFNGDGYEDVLVGAPGATVSGKKGAGYVAVQYGSSRGIGTTRVGVFSQSTTGVSGAAETGDGFGRAVGTGDLDGDGYDDAIVGIPGEDLGTVADAGGAVILWGSPKGLVGANSMWLQSLLDPTAGARFGSAFGAARFTAETQGDQLVVLDRTGAELHLFQAVAATGRTAPHRAVPLRRGAKGTMGSAQEARNIAPKSVSTGDYDDNGWADLVISGVTTGSTDPGHGWSWYISGHENELLFEREMRGGPVTASGDINGDGYDDLVTGEPHSPDDGGASMTGGMVGVYYGSADGPAGVEGVGTPPQWWTQNSPGVPMSSEQGDGWGTDLSVGDTNGDGRADVAIGAAREDIGTVVDAGAVWVLRGSAAGLTATGAKAWHQNSSGVPGTAEKGDRWGGQVRLTDPNRDGRFGLLASAPGENTNDGIIWVLSAGSGGVTASGSWTYGGGSLNAPYLDAQFGAAIDE